MNKLALSWLLALSACGSVTGPAQIDAYSNPITALTITPGTATLTRALDAPKQLVATAMLADATTIDVSDSTTWTSSDSTLATVSSSGLVTPLLAGNVTITAQRGALQATSTLTVRSANLLLADINIGAVSTFDAYATGDVAPTQQIKGTVNTNLASPWGVTVHNGEIYVSDPNKNLISVWPTTANGDVAPTRTITNAALVTPLAVVIANDELFVNLIGGKVLVFPANANGDTAPIRTIAGPATTLGSATYGLAVYKDEIYVTDYTKKQIDVFPANGTGEIAPTRMIVGAHTNLPNPYGLVVENDEIYVQTAAGLVVFAANAQGDTPALRSIGGTMSGNNGVSAHPLGGDIFVTGLGTPASVQVFPRYSTGDQLPARQIAGTMSSTIAGPREMAFY